MFVINATNVNDALAQGIRLLLAHGEEEPSRNGPVLVAPMPVTTVYLRPWERVLFSPMRDANPFFHLMEALWMLSGRNDIAFPTYFNSKFGAYSDDGVTQRGAYGHRWRQWFGYDQLRAVINELKRDPASRRCVLAMWDGGRYSYPYQDSVKPGSEYPAGDLLALTVDKPCNTHIYFRVRRDALEMTVCCRSNDIIWGAYGANAVHMSVLQEYIAAALNLRMGPYRQISHNFHLYTQLPIKGTLEQLAEESEIVGGRYSRLPGYPLVADWERFDSEIGKFIDKPGTVEWREPFLRYVAAPMFLAWQQRKEKCGDGLEYVSRILSSDWRAACVEWIMRREQNRANVEEARPVAAAVEEPVE